MAIDFPNSPQENDLYSEGGTTWIYKSPSWNLYSGSGFVTTSQLSSNLTGYVTASVFNSTIVANRNKYTSAEPIADYNGQIWIKVDDNNTTFYNGIAWTPIKVDLSSYSGNINPSVGNTYDLGTSATRWRNIYTQDLHLSNGIGDYTIVEGEHDLFLINHKNGKSYKFALVEVDKSDVPDLSN